MQLGQKIESYKVIGLTKIINHGDKFPNKNIAARFLVMNARAQYEGYLYSDGKYKIIKGWNYITGVHVPFCRIGEWEYNGTTGEFTAI